MNLNQLQYFMTLAECEHYTNAASQLSITQPALSHAIRLLEEELGAPLFHKKGRNITLSKYGKVFLSYAQESLHILQAGTKKVRSMAGETTGHIDLAYIYTMGREFAPGMIRRFLDSRPDIRVTFHLSVLNTSEIIKGIKEERFDAGFCSARDEEPLLNFIPVFKEELVAVVPKSHPLAGKSTLCLEETVPYPQIYYPKTSGLRPVIDHLFELIGKTPVISYEIEEDLSMAGLVAEGFGIAVMPRIPLPENLQVAVLPLTHPPYERFIYFVYLNHVQLSPAVQTFVNFVRHFHHKF